MSILEAIDHRLTSSGWTRRDAGAQILFEYDGATLHFAVAVDLSHPEYLDVEIRTLRVPPGFACGSGLGFDIEHRGRVEELCDSVLALTATASDEHWRGPLAVFRERWAANVHWELGWTKEDLTPSRPKSELAIASLPEVAPNPSASEDVFRFTRALDAAGWKDPMAVLRKTPGVMVEGGGDAVRDACSASMRTCAEVHALARRLRVHLLNIETDAGPTMVVDYGSQLEPILAALVAKASDLQLQSAHELVAEIAQHGSTWLETASGYLPLASLALTTRFERAHDPENARRGFDGLAAFLDEDGWSPQRSAGEPAFTMGFAGRRGVCYCSARVNLELEQFHFQVEAPLRVPLERRRAMAEFLAGANYGLRIGCFRMDFGDGSLCFESSVDFTGVPLTRCLIKNAVYPAVQTMDRYLPSIFAIVEGTPAADALRIVEG